MPNATPSGPRSPVDGAPTLADDRLLIAVETYRDKLDEMGLRFSVGDGSAQADEDDGKLADEVSWLLGELAARLRASAAPDAAGREDTELLRGTIHRSKGSAWLSGEAIHVEALERLLAARASSASSGGTREELTCAKCGAPLIEGKGAYRGLYACRDFCDQFGPRAASSGGTTPSEERKPHCGLGSRYEERCPACRRLNRAAAPVAQPDAPSEEPTQSREG